MEASKQPRYDEQQEQPDDDGEGGPRRRAVGVNGVEAAVPEEDARRDDPSCIGLSNRSHPGAATCYVWTVPPAERGARRLKGRWINKSLKR